MIPQLQEIYDNLKTLRYNLNEHRCEIQADLCELCDDPIAEDLVAELFQLNESIAGVDREMKEILSYEG